MSMFGEILTPAQLAEELQTTTSQLSQWRYMGRGPRFLKEGHFIRWQIGPVGTPSPAIRYFDSGDLVLLVACGVVCSR